MITRWFFILTLIPALAYAGNFGVPVIPLPQDNIDYTDYQQYYPQPDSAPDLQPLFAQSCDNIKYTGAIENQAIAILNDTREFITGVTDPIVNVTKFEAGIFVYSFVQCLEENAVIALNPTKCAELKKKSPSASCLSANEAIKAISETTGNLTYGCGVGTGSLDHASANANCKLTANKDFVVSSMGQLMSKGDLSEDLFDSILQCVSHERSKALRFLNDLFTKNFTVKTSIINSINAKCNVSAYESGDPTSWKEIYELQKELTPGIGETYEQITTFLDDPANNPSVNDLKNKPGLSPISTGPCADGFGQQPCLTNADRNLQHELSQPAYSPLELQALFSSDGYQEKKEGILAYLYDSNNDLKPIYGDFVQGVLDDAELEDNVVLPKHTRIFLDLKNRFGIHSGTKLDISLNEIMNSIFPSKAFFAYSNGLNSATPMLMPLDYPFKDEIIIFSTTAPADTSLIVLKTREGNYISVNSTIYPRLTTLTIVDLYRKYSEKIISDHTVTPGSLDTPELNVFMTSQLASQAIHDLVGDSIEDFIAQANAPDQNYNDIIGSDNPITGLSPFYRAATIEYIFKSYAMRSAIIEFFNDSSNSTVIDMIVTSQPKMNIPFSTISNVKDFTIPRNLSGDIIYKQIRKFFQLFLIKLNEINLDANIIALSDKIEDYSKNSEQTQILNRIEAKVNKALSLNQVLNASTFNFRE